MQVQQSAYKGSAGTVLVEHLDPAADSERGVSAVGGILENQLAGGGPPVIAAVVLVRELQFAVHNAALRVAVLLLGAGRDGRVGGVAAHAQAVQGSGLLSGTNM